MAQARTFWSPVPGFALRLLVGEMAEELLLNGQRAMNNFAISGIIMPERFIRSLGLIKAAAAKANAELGELDSELAEAICAAALRIAEGKYLKQFPVEVFQTGSGTSSNMNANEVIAALASEQLKRPVHANDHVNCGQSSNDVIPTA